MKKYILIVTAIVFGTVSIAIAQDKIDKYCQVTVLPKNGYTTKRIARIYFGENKWLFSPKDTTVVQKLKYVNSLTTETDVLNYMSKLGWKFISYHSGIGAFSSVLFFKKTFDVNEFIPDAPMAD